MAKDLKEKLIDLFYRVSEATPVYIGKGVNAFFTFVLGGTEAERNVKRLSPLRNAINALEPKMKALSDGELRGVTAKLKERLGSGETLDDILPEAFAAVREASVRTIRLRHFDVQLIGGICLHQGKIAEMATGEGKTLVATLPAYLNALMGRGVHVVTVNDYLARRDRQWMGPIYEFLGLTVGVIQSDMDNAERRAAYHSDITYGTNNEFGFDYLRDNMKLSIDDQVQRELYYAIVDEVDNVLIDEARTPLIISGPAEESPDKYYIATRLARRLRKGSDYEVNEKEHRVTLTEEGIVNAQRFLGVDSFYTGKNLDWPHYIDVALRAKELYRRDRDYIVHQGEIIIVDEFTGRLMHGRRWSDGLHQAVEAKEGLAVKEENQTLATITFQNYFKLYKKLAGMTGTAATEAGEFIKIYNLEVSVIPTNRPLLRTNHPDLIYGTAKEKWDAVVEEIVRTHRTGRPILVGTTSIEHSEMLSQRLREQGLAHNVLNAKQHEREAKIIAEAGQLGALTIATNMAGRGTDIVLGKQSLAEILNFWKESGLAPQDASLDMPPEELDRLLVKRWAEEFLPPDERHSDDTDELLDRLEERWKFLGMFPLPLPSEMPDGGVAALGGLHVIGTERHEARRIDNQLRGRSGRQGDPGSSRFFVSLDDDLMRMFMAPWVRNLMIKAGLHEGEPIESGMVTRAIEKAQKRVEEQNFEIRKQLLEYDEVMNEQRKLVYGQRQDILRGTTPGTIEAIVDQLLATHIPAVSYDAKSRNFNPLARHLKRVGVKLDLAEWRSVSQAELPALVSRRHTESRAGAPAEADVRDHYQRLCSFFLSGGRVPEKKKLRRLRTWVQKYSLEFSRKVWEEELEQALLDAMVAEIRTAASGIPFEEFARDWIGAGLEQDFPSVHYTGKPDYDQFRKWGEPVGLKMDIREWDPLVGKREKIEALLVQKSRNAWHTGDEPALREKLIRHSCAIWLGSTGFTRNPAPEQIAGFAMVRFGVEISPEPFRKILRETLARTADALSQMRLAQLRSDRRDAALGEWLAEYVELFLVSDFEAADRNLHGLSRDLSQRLGINYPPFDLSKLDRRELKAAILKKYAETHAGKNRGESVEEMSLRMIEDSVSTSLAQFVDPKTGAEAESRSFDPLAAYANSLGLRVTAAEWRTLDRDQLRHLLVRRALAHYADEPPDETVSRFVRAAVGCFLASSSFKSQHSYRGLAEWAVKTFKFTKVGPGLELELETKVRHWVDETKAAIRREKVAHYQDSTIELEEAARQMADNLCEAYRSIQPGEDVDYYALARVLSQKTSVGITEEQLATAEEESEGGAVGLIINRTGTAYRRHNYEKLTADFVEAVFTLFLETDRFFTEWQPRGVQRWLELTGLDSFSPETWRDDVSELLSSHIVEIAQQDYKERDKTAVIRDCFTASYLTATEAELGEDARDLRSVCATFLRKFDVALDPYELSKLGYDDLRRELVERAHAAYWARKAALGEETMIRTCSALLLYTIDTKWKDHLYAVDHLKSGIGLRGYAGIDPKIAYKKEAWEMYEAMIRSTEDLVTDFILKVAFEDRETPRASWTVGRYIHSEDSAIARHKQMQEQAARNAGKEERKRKPVRVAREPGPNDPCPCGAKNSDGTPRKYKKCCMVKKQGA